MNPGLTLTMSCLTLTIHCYKGMGFPPCFTMYIRIHPAPLITHRWASPTISPELSLPPPNTFIATDFTLTGQPRSVGEAWPCTPPSLLCDQPGIRCVVCGVCLSVGCVFEYLVDVGMWRVCRWCLVGCTHVCIPSCKYNHTIMHNTRMPSCTIHTHTHIHPPTQPHTQGMAQA